MSDSSIKSMGQRVQALADGVRRTGQPADAPDVAMTVMPLVLDNATVDDAERLAFKTAWDSAFIDEAQDLTPAARTMVAQLRSSFDIEAPARTFVDFNSLHVARGWPWTPEEGAVGKVAPGKITSVRLINTARQAVWVSAPKSDGTFSVGRVVEDRWSKHFYYPNRPGDEMILEFSGPAGTAHLAFPWPKGQDDGGWAGTQLKDSARWQADL